MITLKIRAYTKEQLQMLYDVFGEGAAMITSINCTGDCRNCVYKHPCHDLDEAQEFLAKELQSRQGI